PTAASRCCVALWGGRWRGLPYPCRLDAVASWLSGPGVGAERRSGDPGAAGCPPLYRASGFRLLSLRSSTLSPSRLASDWRNDAIPEDCAPIPLGRPPCGRVPARDLKTDANRDVL